MKDYTMIRDNDMLDAISMIEDSELKIFKLFPEAHMPIYGTEWSACFDLKASIRPTDTLTVYRDSNEKRKSVIDPNNGNGYVLYSGERVLVPTGLVFDLTEAQSLRIHPRSGLAWKSGITVANCEGVVDADYVQQTYVMLQNISDQPFVIRDGDRIAQAEIVRNNRVWFVETTIEPKEKTDRTGGLGSTGVQ
jgi:dUTP pyrophosphatase